MTARRKESNGEARELLQRLCYKNYGSAKLYEAAKLNRRMRGSRPVLIYQMGKVGSMTVARSLRAASGLQPLHVHHLDPAELVRLDGLFARRFAETQSIPDCLTHGEYCRARLERPGWRTGLQVITLVRDPVARNISAFFHGLPYRHPDFNLPQRLERSTPAEVAQALLPLFRELFDQELPLRWFDSELKAVLGVDVFAANFPRDEGYGLVEAEGVQVCAIKLEHLDRCGAEALGRFLDREHLALQASNVAEKKRYYPVYQEFRRLAQFDDEYLDRMYDSRLVRHFYSPEEIEGFRRRWQRRRPAAFPAPAGTPAGLSGE